MSPARLAMPIFNARRRLELAIAISLALHALLLTLHFKFPDAASAMREKAMDIVLVNSKSAKKPREAQALAQANLDGGGNTDENRRARTPLPPTLHQSAGADIEQMQRRVPDLESRQQTLLTQAKSLRLAAPAESAAEQPSPVASVTGFDLAESARAMARLEGEVSKSVDEYNKRPRKKFIGGRTEEYGLASYFDAWKQKIERIGTLNYPLEARGKFYGAVVIYVELNAEDGSIYNAEISRSSGHKMLDQAAMRILRMSAPFGAISREALGGATVLSFSRTWNFVQGDQLSSSTK